MILTGPTKGKGSRPQRSVQIVAALVLLLGVVLRVASLGWNDRLQGDVNLFALTAREFAQRGELAYPLRYEYSNAVPYCSLSTPASQHPPLWPLTAGFLARGFGSDATFPLLKALSLVAGLLVLALSWRRSQGTADAPAWMLALMMMAVSPLLVDYSANGSMYGAIALLAWLLSERWPKLGDDGMGSAIVTGVLASVAVQVHPLAIPLPLVLGVQLLRRRAFRALAAFCASGVAVAAPYVIWNLQQFGVPFHSPASAFFLMKLGLLSEGVEGGHLTLVEQSVGSVIIAKRYVEIVLGNVATFASGLSEEVGPFCVVLSVIGLVKMRRESPARLAGLLAVFGSILAMLLLWGQFKLTRFLVPILPAVYVTAAGGAVALWHRARIGTPVAILLMLGTLGWSVPAYMEQPRTRYYRNDAELAAAYVEMKGLALALAQHEKGPVLGASLSLDGGMEAVYWHRFPLVRGRRFASAGTFSADELRGLARDFDVRYVWTDARAEGSVKRAFPEAHELLRSRRFAVLELPRSGHRSTVCPVMWR